jgi:hypothetical protein
MFIAILEKRRVARAEVKSLGYICPALRSLSAASSRVVSKLSYERFYCDYTGYLTNVLRFAHIVMLLTHALFHTSILAPLCHPINAERAY